MKESVKSVKEKINGLNINYEIKGEGFPVLILHGWGGCIDSMLPITNNLKDKYKTITVDFTGHGSSDFPITPMGVEDYSDIIYKLLNILNIKELIIIGHSFGGRVGIVLSSKYQNMIKKMILIDSGGIKPKATIKQKIQVITYKFIKNILKVILFNSKFYQNIMINLRRKSGSEDYRNLPEVMKTTFVKIVTQDLTDMLGLINCQVLIIWGEKDTDTPIYMGRIMEEKIKNSGLVVLEDAGHFSYIDQSYKCNIIINKFLEEERKV